MKQYVLSRDNMRAVDEQIHAAGAWVFTGGLHEPSTAIVLSPRARRCRSFMALR
jgi:hypothetical protein